MVETARDEIIHLAGSIRALERQLEAALAKRRIELNYKVHDGVVCFEQVVIARHRLLKARLLRYMLGARPAMILTAPAIYALVIPLLLLDLFVAIYQTVCFPVYGIPRVHRSDYLAFDRGQLAYLNAVEKLNALTAPMRTACWRTCAKSLPAPRSTGAPSNTRGACSACTRAMAAFWTMATVTPIEASWSVFGRRRDPASRSEAHSATARCCVPGLRP
jgi:hypothetical protein